MAPNSKSLSWTDTSGNVYHYYENPLFKAAFPSLMLECCERCAFYGMMTVFTTFLTNHLGMSDAAADSYNQVFNSLAYVTPLIASIISDLWLGAYFTILTFSSVYTLGLALLVVAASFQHSAWMVHIAFLGLLTVGTGGIKAAVNVFGAQQFHPDEHREITGRYYTYFYASINVGSLVGGIAVPIVYSETSFQVAFAIPLASFAIGILLFVLGWSRFVKMKTQRSVVVDIFKVYFVAIRRRSFEVCKKSNGGKYDDNVINDSKHLLHLLPLFALIIPFIIAYGQMTTSWVTQGKKMDNNLFGWDMPPQLMQNVDSIGVLISTVLVDLLLYRYLRSIRKMPSIPIRFAMGCLCGVAAILCSYGVEVAIASQDKINSVSVWYQAVQYFLISLGEIFLVSSSYEFAYTEAPDALKVVASALLLLFIAIGSAISGVLFTICKPWLPDFHADDVTSWSSKYGRVHYDYFLLLLAGICGVGVLLSIAIIPYYNKVKKHKIDSQATIAKPSCYSRKDIPHVGHVKNKHKDLDDEF